MFNRTGSTDRGAGSAGRLGRGLVVLMGAGLLGVLPAVAAPASPVASAAPELSCFGEPPTIVEDREGATVVGTDRRDVIVVRAAAEVHARGGNDLICGYGRIWGDKGRDRISMRDNSDDPIITEAFGGPGGDRLEGGPNPYRLMGGRGNDRLEGKGRAILMDGGPGKDRLLGGPSNDRMVGGPGHDGMSAGQGRDLLLGMAGDDSIYGYKGADEARGHAGDDRILGGRGVDRVDGGSGWDQCSSETVLRCESLPVDP